VAEEAPDAGPARRGAQTLSGKTSSIGAGDGPGAPERTGRQARTPLFQLRAFGRVDSMRVREYSPLRCFVRKGLAVYSTSTVVNDSGLAIDIRRNRSQPVFRSDLPRSVRRQVLFGTTYLLPCAMVASCVGMRPLTLREETVRVVPNMLLIEEQAPEFRQEKTDLLSECNRVPGTERIRTFDPKDLPHFDLQKSLVSLDVAGLMRRAHERGAQAVEVIAVAVDLINKYEAGKLLRIIPGRETVPWLGGPIGYKTDDWGNVTPISLPSPDTAMDMLRLLYIWAADVQFWQCPTSLSERATGALTYRVHREPQLFTWSVHPPRECDHPSGVDRCELQVFKNNGELLTRGDDGFSGLSKAVAPHSLAVSHALQAEALGRSSTSKLYAATVSSIALLASTAVGVVGYFKHNTPMTLGGAGGMVVSIPFVWGFTISASTSALAANTEAMNAVDIYDDDVAKKASTAGAPRETR
jgi:hypothetical protein